MSNTNPARGMRDFLPSDVRKREYIISIIKEVYQKYGFEPLETPSVENLETLTGKYGEEGNQLIFKILKRGEKLDLAHGEKGLSDLALRYDLTVPLARVVANYQDKLPKFFKRYQIQPVWRADRPARGRFREFYQCDVDAIGSKSMVVEAELISAVCEILERLGFEDFVIKLNHRELLREMLNASGIGEIKQTDALTAIDKLDKIGVNGVLKEFAERNIDENTGQILLGLFEKLENLDNSRTLSELENFVGQKTESLASLWQILNLANNFRIKIEASLARGLSYYTGAIFEISVPDLAGSLGGGGRYDGLIGMFGKEEIPACGFSLGLERILVVMEERGMFPPELQQNSADVLVTIWNEESIAESLKLANELRQTDLRVTVYPEADKLSKQFKYASSINIPFVCVLGENELAKGQVAIKNLTNGQQELVNRGELKDYFAKVF
jgi:histidyl-tRNA synthetase